MQNVTFEHADAQVHRFPRERFDLAMSRFGTMFFDDPVAAFANVGRALRPAGRLVMMVWQASDRNEWEVAIRQALAEGTAATGSAGPDAFSPWSDAVLGQVGTIVYPVRSFPGQAGARRVRGSAHARDGLGPRARRRTR